MLSRGIPIGCGRPSGRRCAWGMLCLVALIGSAAPGCGTTKSVTATEQLLMSDAVDSTISKIDFRPLNGYKIYLDTTYVAPAGKPIPGVAMPVNLVTSDYIISALRQQLTAAGCMLVDSRDTADIICEARCGALGTDGHNVIYGLPANNVLNSASVFVASAQNLPTIPELSLARREVKSAAAKVAVFAYDRETREPLWQSGIAQAGSNARDTWVMGVGPIQYGTIYRGTRFAGKRFGKPNTSAEPSAVAEVNTGIDHRSQHLFANQLFGNGGLEAATATAKAQNPDAKPQDSSQPAQAAAPGGTVAR